MVPKVVVDEAGDEEIAVVVAALAPQLQRMTNGSRGLLQVIRSQLTLQEGVVEPLVDQQRQPLRRRSNQVAGIPGAPAGAIRTEVAAEGLLTPGAAAGVADRRKGRDGTVEAGIAQGTDEGAVPPSSGH